MKHVVFTIVAMLCIGIAGTAANAAPITTESLIQEMTDLARLAEFPDPFYKVVQYSSYDRQSNLPGGPQWFANSDGFGGEKVPNFEAILTPPVNGEGPGEYLVCDVEGPGAIVRTWSAAIKGTIRMYLDNAETPIYDGPAEPFFKRLYDAFLQDSGIDAKVLDSAFYQRDASYCPIPFAKHCRIVWSGDVKEIHFYQLEIRHYAPEAGVVTFAPGQLKDCTETVRCVVKTLVDPDFRTLPQPVEESSFSSKDINSGGKAEVFNIEGSRAIIYLMLVFDAEDLDLALRQTILNIYFDGFPQAQVQTPLGDFFGQAPGIHPYQSLPFTVLNDGIMYCRFVMPFQKQCRIVLENLGEQPVHIKGIAQHFPYTWIPERSMHFHARWRVDHGLTASGFSPMDVPFLLANGAGNYVGTVSYVLNPNEIPSSGGNWWGEGDEKVFTDDDTQPSLFGTGSEDYYNYSWSSSDIFAFPYCGQPVNDGPANRGFVANYRWHILDSLPFKQRISFYMELFPHERNENMAYARIGYYYARPGCVDDHFTITREDVREQKLPETWSPKARGGAGHSLFFEAEDCVQPGAETCIIENPMWAGKGLLVWAPRLQDSTISFNISIPEKKKYEIKAVVMRNSNSGRFSVQLDGENLQRDGETGILDLNESHGTLSRECGMGEKVLEPGEHTITFRNELAGIEMRIGVDFFWLQERE